VSFRAFHFMVALDEREVFIPSSEHRIGGGAQRVTSSTVQEEHDGIVAIVPCDRDLLVDGSDLNEPFFFSWLGPADG
jgi:hypothetical protein